MSNNKKETKAKATKATEKKTAEKKTAETKKKVVSMQEFTEILATSEKTKEELEKEYSIEFPKDFAEKAEAKTEKAKNTVKENKTVKTLFSMLETKKSEFIELKEKTTFNSLMLNETAIKEIFSNENFCSKEQIEFNEKQFAFIETTSKNTIREKTLNLFRCNVELIFNIAKNQIMSIMTAEEKKQFSFIACDKSLYICDKKEKSAVEILNFRKESDKLRALKNAYYMQISNVTEKTKEFFKKWKVELSEITE